MNRMLFVAACSGLMLFAPVQGRAQPAAWPAQLPVYDHVLIVVEENKDVGEILGNKAAPYINGVLAHEGAILTQMYAEEHKSEGNYFWLLSGSNQNVGFTDAIPDSTSCPGYPFASSNLGEQLIARGFSFKGYAEDLPAIGSTLERVGLYARKHVPWISFANIPGGPNPDSSANLQFAQFPADFTKLPTVCFVIPNLINDMHDGKPPASVKKGDLWLKKNLDPYYQWAKSHNSLLIVTFDESEDPSGMTGLTDPAAGPSDAKNRIPTIVAGAHVIHGAYPEGKGVTHVNILRTLEAMYGLPPSGRQQPNAEAFGIGPDMIITDIFAAARAQH